MSVYKKLTILIITIFLLNSCVILPGINENPNKKSLNEKLATSKYTIDDVKINIIKINKLSDEDLKRYSKNQFNNIENEIKNYPEIYDYTYEYILGTSDSIGINLTDTDDLDGVYEIDQEGMIDLPFIGKIKLGDLTLNEAQNLLIQIVKSFYKNPDLQIGIEEFNSNKVYIVGAVRNQITIPLNQQPLTLIEAAIQADFNPSAQDKLFGTSGLLRRDGKVYKINLTNTFKNNDEKENFYLKKNDVIFIDKNSNSIHIFGEINEPGTYFPDLNYSLTELLSSVGINQLTANAEKVFVIREKFETFLEVDVFQLDIRNPVNLIAGKKFKVKKGDIIFVPTAEIAKWNRAISLLIPQTNLFNSYRPIIKNNLGIEK
tara:strand:- start:1468 stop:2589 length:1122 start_codon:yes stop_codon:yes gene_type:complete